jgi:hypothetical protein
MDVADFFDAVAAPKGVPRNDIGGYSSFFGRPRRQQGRQT